jgi:Zn-dependent protease with chaperone function
MTDPAWLGSVVPPGEQRERPATLAVDGDRVRATCTQESPEVFSIPFSALDLEAGGFDGDFVFCRTRGGLGPTICSRDPAFKAALARVGAGIIDAELVKLAVHARTRSRAKWIGVGLLLGFFGLVAGALWSVPRLLAASVVALPTSVDAEIGEAAWSQVPMDGPVVDAPPVVEFVEDIVARLEPHAAVEGFDFRVTVVDSETINAFALPGGRIVVFTGLIEKATRPEQIAGVLAHEMAHVTRRHGMRNMAMSASLVAGLQVLLGDSSAWLVIAGEVGAFAMQNAYSREQESDADAEGVRMLLAARIDPEGLAEFFELLQREPGPQLEGAMTWLSTHPDHAARVAHVRGLAREAGSPAPPPLALPLEAVQDLLAATP